MNNIFSEICSFFTDIKRCSWTAGASQMLNCFFFLARRIVSTTIPKINACMFIPWLTCQIPSVSRQCRWSESSPQSVRRIGHSGPDQRVRRTLWHRGRSGPLHRFISKVGLHWSTCNANLQWCDVARKIVLVNTPLQVFESDSKV